MIKVSKTEDGMIFNLSNQKVSYVIQIVDNKFVTNRYFGPALPFFAESRDLDEGHHAFAVYEEGNKFSVSNLPLEYSFSQNGDYRQCSSEVRDADNLPLTFAKYVSYDEEAVHPDNLPQLRSKNGNFLNLYLKDETTSLEVILHYFLLDDLAGLVRWVTYKNTGSKSLNIEKANSLQLDIPDTDLNMLSFYGTHANEFVPSVKPIPDGIEEISSNRGSSSPQHHPFVALIDKHFDLNHGNFVACNLMWSGSFKIGLEKDQSNQIRLNAGINEDNFDWKLEPGTIFNTPQAILLFGQNGLGEMSSLSQQIIKDYVVESRITKPLLTLNTWESAYFDIDEKKSLEAVDQAKEIGANLLVIDDGWFENRNSEDGQLGDWIVDKDKFPNTLQKISDVAHQNKIKFGLWIEPEMITTSSKLFHKHPDWILGINSLRNKLYSRNQLVLDLSKIEVQDHLIEVLSKLIEENQIDYLKWDFNRQLAPTFSQGVSRDVQGKVEYKYVLGLYHILETLRNKYPKLIIENCASGGGRVDAGMLYYTDQTWISDLTDSLGRFRILTNMATLYPLEVFSSHFSKSPNEQDGRILPVETRMILSSLGSLGFELDLDKLSSSEIDMIKELKDWYVDNYYLLHDSICLPLTPLRQNATDTIGVLLKGKSDSLVIYSYGATDAVHQPQYLPLKYLDESRIYYVADRKISGVELNYAGVTIPPVMGDFRVKAIKIFG